MDDNDCQREDKGAEPEKKNAAVKKGVLIGVVAVVGALLIIALPLIVIGRGCGLF